MGETILLTKKMDVMGMVYDVGNGATDHFSIHHQYKDIYNPWDMVYKKLMQSHGTW